jgi:hypothetical protein
MDMQETYSLIFVASLRQLHSKRRLYMMIEITKTFWILLVRKNNPRTADIQSVAASMGVNEVLRGLIDVNQS